MHEFPSKSTMIILILAITVFSTYRYALKVDNKLIQNTFDWSNEKKINSFDGLLIDSVSYNYLGIYNFDPGLTLNYQNTYTLEKANRKKYYFRFAFSIKTDSLIQIRGVEWLTGVPDFTQKPITLIESDIPLKEKKGKTVVSIGNEILVKNEAKYFRRKLASETDLNFEGRFKDVYNYKHEATNSDEWYEKLDEVDSISSAEIYILMGSFSEDLISNDDFIFSLNKFIKSLSKKEGNEMILWILLPKVKNDLENQKRHKINELIKSLEEPKLFILDSDSILGDKANYLMPDSVQLNKYGYEKLAEEVIKMIKEVR